MNKTTRPIEDNEYDAIIETIHIPSRETSHIYSDKLYLLVLQLNRLGKPEHKAKISVIGQRVKGDNKGVTDELPSYSI